MNRFLYYTALIALVFLSISCENVAGTPDPLSNEVFLTGECLASNELICYMAEREEGELVQNNKYRFAWELNITSTVVEENYSPTRIHPREIPSKECYKEFGDRKNAVKQAYNEVFYSFGPQYFGRIDIITVLYDGGLSLVADKEFAGHPAGEELAPYIVQRRGSASGQDRPEECLSFPRNSRDSVQEYLNIPLKYGCVLGRFARFDFPVDGFEPVEEKVNFEVLIPVKVVNYLHWLDAKLMNPNAPVPYQEDTLHCSFHTWWNMK